MTKIVIGIIIGGVAAMVFPDHAATVYEFIRDYIHQGASAVADQTNG